MAAVSSGAERNGLKFIGSKANLLDAGMPPGGVAVIVKQHIEVSKLMSAEQRDAYERQRIPHRWEAATVLDCAEGRGPVGSSSMVIACFAEREGRRA